VRNKNKEIYVSGLMVQPPIYTERQCHSDMYTVLSQYQLT